VNENRLHNKRSATDVVILTVLLLFCFSTLYPFLNLLFVSLSSIEDVIRSNGTLLYPKSFNFEGYRYVLRHSNLVTAYKTTLYITVVGTTINLLMTTLGAYVLSNRDMPGRNLLMVFVLITMFFSGGLIPLYLLIRSLGMINTLWALMIPGAINTWLLILTRNFFQGIPAELRESAKIDGCSEFGILARVILPLSMPIMATLVLFYGVAHWNEYVGVIIYINDAKIATLQVVLRGMYETTNDQLESDRLPPPVETVRAAGVMLATLPIICVYPFLQKYFVHGMMVGSLKG
jgi:putative aldouronate transport system permease protein